jgi:hypothetical protein
MAHTPLTSRTIAVYTSTNQTPTLSNSSMQQMPLSDSTSAPDSSTMSLVSGSRTTEAVRPTAELPLPEV